MPCPPAGVKVYNAKLSSHRHTNGVKPYWYWANGCDGTVTEQNGESLVSLVCSGIEGCDGNVTEIVSSCELLVASCELLVAGSW